MMSKYVSCLAVVLALIGATVPALARAPGTHSVRVLLDDHDHSHDEDHAGHVEPAASEGDDGEAEGHGEGAEDHAGHVEPAADEGDDGEAEGHGEGAELGEGADGEFEGGQEGGEGLDGEWEGGTEGAVNTTGTAVPEASEGEDGVLEGQGEGEAVVGEASAAWTPARLAIAATAAAVVVAL
eukprot:jgi/Ulvmu1/3174/UM015_0215.1